MSKRVIIPVVAIVLFASAIYLNRGSLSLKLMQRALPKIMLSDVQGDLPDGLTVGICGAGGPLPDPKRSGPCVVVMAGENMIMIDAGTNGLRNVNRMRLPIGQLDALLLTHFHSDHIDGMGEVSTMRWVNAANTSPLPVYGPTGVENLVNGFNLAYQADTTYRHAHHGDTVAPLSGAGMVAKAFQAPPVGSALKIYQQGGLSITTFQVDHEPVSPAVAYRLEYGGRSVVISGDTAQSSNLEEFSEDADLLIHEALSRKLVNVMNESAAKIGNHVVQKVTADILDYHASPVEAANSATTAKVKHLAFYHIVPPLILPGSEAVYLDGVSEAYSGPITVTQDGTIFSLPSNSVEINVVSKSL